MFLKGIESFKVDSSITKPINKNRELEKAAIKWLLKCTNYKKYFLLEDLTETGRAERLPDFLLSSSSQEKLFIEVTHPFLDDRAAQILLKQGEYKNQHQYEESEEKFIAEINRKIKDKCSINYKTENTPVSLLIRSTARLFFLEEFQKYKNDILIPPNNFKEILLLFPQITTEIVNFIPPIKQLPNKVIRLIHPFRGTLYHFPANTGEWTDLEVLQSQT